MCVHGLFVMVGLCVGVYVQKCLYREVLITTNTEGLPFGCVPSPNNLPGAAQVIKIQLHILNMLTS